MARIKMCVSLKTVLCDTRTSAEIGTVGPAQATRCPLSVRPICVCLLLLLFSGRAMAYDVDVLVQGLLMRDSLVESVTVDFSTRSSFPDGRDEILPKRYRYVFRDDKVYMETSTEDQNGRYRSEAALADGPYLNINHTDRQAFTGVYPPWANSTYIRQFFRPGLQDAGDSLLGEWLRNENAVLLGQEEVDGCPVYIVSDGGKDNPISVNGLGYDVWVSPEQGFVPVRIDEYRNGALHHVFQFSDFTAQSDMLVVPGRGTVWYLDVGRKVRDFDPASPPEGWVAKVDLEFDEFVYNKEAYPDSFFDLEIPEGYVVTDNVVGISYVMGGRVTELSVERLVENLAFSLNGDDAVYRAEDSPEGETPPKHDLASPPASVKSLVGLKVLLLTGLFAVGLISAVLFSRRRKHDSP